MTEKEASKLTRYFSEGVRAHIWCYSGAGDWAVSITREGGSAQFLKLDELKRSVLSLRKSIKGGDVRDLRLYRGSFLYSTDQEIAFETPDDAFACIEQIGAAVRHIQSQTKHSDWFDVPSDVFGGPPLAPSPDRDFGHAIRS